MNTLDELDKLAAEVIMQYPKMPHVYTYYNKTTGITEYWQPTRNITQAWECLGKFPAFQFFCRYPQANPRYECVLYTGELNSINPETVVMIEAQSATEAIVRACLKAKGVAI